ncbi:hypothetical protein [Chloroherpeton thalassium]|nr:hypothetical protein [Chloroherpeton thalassium]
MLHKAGAWLGTNSFNPTFGQSMMVYAMFSIVMVLTALVARSVKQVLDPTGEKQLQRQREVLAGKREKLFVSFAGSLATSFGFGVLTAATYMLLAGFLKMDVQLTFVHILTASLFNVAAGVIASILVGVVFLVLKQMGKLPEPQSI